MKICDCNGCRKRACCNEELIGCASYEEDTCDNMVIEDHGDKCMFSDECELVANRMMYGDMDRVEALEECCCDNIGCHKLRVDFDQCGNELFVFLNGKRIDVNVLGRVIQYGECPGYGCKACSFVPNDKIEVSFLANNNLCDKDMDVIIDKIKNEVDSPLCGWCE